MAPLVVWLLRDRPSDVGVAPYGGTPEDEPPVVRIGAARVALRALADAARTKPFWYLAGGMAICGATTFGLIQPHFVPAAHDHGLPITVGAGLLAPVGISTSPGRSARAGSPTASTPGCCCWSTTCCAGSR